MSPMLIFSFRLLYSRQLYRLKVTKSRSSMLKVTVSINSMLRAIKSRNSIRWVNNEHVKKLKLYLVHHAPGEQVHVKSQNGLHIIMLKVTNIKKFHAKDDHVKKFYNQYDHVKKFRLSMTMSSNFIISVTMSRNSMLVAQVNHDQYYNA